MKKPLVLLLVGACAAQPVDPVARAETCRTLFQRYDRDLIFEPDRTGLTDFVFPERIELFPGRHGTESALLQYDCITHPGAFPDLSGGAAAYAEFANPGGGSGPRRYIHLAILTSMSDEAALGGFLADLGYPVRAKGARRLGRRVFIGALTGRRAENTALRLADALGFTSAYALSRVP